VSRFKGEIEFRLRNHLDKATPDSQGFIQVPARDVQAAVHVIIELKDFRRFVINKATKSMEKEKNEPQSDKKG
jgi:hypothetical protein